MAMPDQISHYSLQEELGRGGMGIVYRARDERLGRDVAVKVLSSGSVATTEEMERFYREARSAATLSHPHIATVYDIGEFVDEGGVSRPFIAMEYVDGEPLSDVIARGPLPLDEVTRIGGQIAHALDAAHEQGIVHRDIKPANILVSSDGTAKVLDFGIARHTSATTLTEEGSTVGTVAYMSPEQTRGQPVDGRTDIWSLGVLIYEMVTGRKPFVGAYDQAIMYSILNEDPEPLTAIRTGVPMELEVAVSKALEKDPEDRYQRARELRIDLDRLARGTSRTTVVASSPKTSPRRPDHSVRRYLPWFVAVAATVGAIVMISIRGSEPAVVAKYLAVNTDTLLLGEHPATSVVAISPDGSQMVYAASRGGTPQLFLRAVGSYDAVPIPGTEGGSGPFFSPDGRWLGFVADGVLHKTTLDGGSRIAICRADWFHGGTWGEDNAIILSVWDGTEMILSSVSADGGTPRQVTLRIEGESRLNHLWPESLPGGSHVLFASIDSGAQNPMVWVLSLETGERRFLTRGGNPRYLPTGHVVFPRGGSLWAATLSDDFEIEGEPFVVADDLLMGFTFEPAIGHFATSRTGTLVYLPGEGSASPANTISLVGEDTIPRPVMTTPRTPGGVRMSADGSRITLRMPDNFEQMQVWVFDIARETLTQLTHESQNWWPVWTPDGSRIAFPFVTPATDTDIWWAPGDGVREASVLVGAAEIVEIPYSFSADGRTLFYQKEERLPTGWDLWAVDVDDPGSARPIMSTNTSEINPAISPDGQWLAYAGARIGSEQKSEVYVVDYPDISRRWQISSGGGHGPAWSHDGRRLYYEETAQLEVEEQGQTLYVVDWITEPDVGPGRPQPVYSGDHVSSILYGRNFDVTSAGEILIIQTEEPEPRTRLNIVVDWFAELETLAP